jgi:hypothetical protein
LAQLELIEQSPSEPLLPALELCQTVEDFTEVAKFFDRSDLRSAASSSASLSPVEKEQFLETAILYSRLEIRGKLQRWWDSALYQVRDFWRFLSQQESLSVGGSC